MLKKFRGYDTDAESVITGVAITAASKAVQSEKENCDINVIVKRFGVTGVVPGTVRPLSYENYEDVFDFQSAMNAVRSADETFAALPADLRRRFANNPQLYLEFCSKAENLPEMRRLGMALPEPEKPAEPAELVPA